MNTNTRLRIATRIHFALLRHLGEGIDVGAMLKRESEAREVLWVCDALAEPELAALASQYRRCCELEAQAARPAGGQAPQDAAWAKDTSGFGLSHLADSVAPATPKLPSAAKRFDPMGWLRRGQSAAR